MTGAEYRKAIKHLGLSQVSAAKFLGVDETTSRRWVANKHPIPDAVAMLLSTMVSQGLVPGEVANIAKGEH